MGEGGAAEVDGPFSADRSAIFSFVLGTLIAAIVGVAGTETTVRGAGVWPVGTAAGTATAAFGGTSGDFWQPVFAVDIKINISNGDVTKRWFMKTSGAAEVIQNR